MKARLISGLEVLVRQQPPHARVFMLRTVGEPKAENEDVQDVEAGSLSCHGRQPLTMAEAMMKLLRLMMMVMMMMMTMMVIMMATSMKISENTLFLITRKC